MSRVIPYRAQMGQHEITQKHTYLMGYSNYQKGTGTFVVVLADVTACLAALSQSVTSAAVFAE